MFRSVLFSLFFGLHAFAISDIHPHVDIAAGGYGYCQLSTDRVSCISSNFGSGGYEPRFGFVNAKEIAVGTFHTCVIDDGGVWCWGQDAFGESSPPELKNPHSLVAGERHTCAIDQDKVVCWGGVSAVIREVPAGLKDVRQLTAGESHTCALQANGKVVCWGDNDSNQLNVPELSGVKEVDAWAQMTCVMNNSEIQCTNGQKVSGDFSNARDLEVSYHHKCYIDGQRGKCIAEKERFRLDREFQNPKNMEVGYMSVCVLDDLRNHCFGAHASKWYKSRWVVNQ